MWPATAQDRVWDENADALIASSVIFPAGNARRVKGGYDLSGRWPFCSGVDLSQWVMLGGTVEPRNGEAPDRRMFLVPRSDLGVLETWDVSGLCGTGSKDVTLEGAFVAEDMTLGADEVRGGDTPGSAVNPGPLYKLPVQGLFPHIVAAPIVGMAWGATDDFVAANAAAQSTYNTTKVARHPTFQIHLADAAAAVEAARTMLYANCEEAIAIFDAGGTCGAAEKHRWRRDATYGANRCADAVTRLYRATGGKAAYKSNPIQRHYRDVAVGISHISMSWDVIGAEYGSFALGVGGNPNI
jgi:3-hydroxy-9,10-secoandrosta-1,3,5(10)-triene-9,17-dione monooxygenase